MVSLKDAHADTGVMGDLFKRQKKKGDNSHQTEVIQTTLPLLKDSDRLPLFRETVGRGTSSKIQGSLAEDRRGTYSQHPNFSYFQKGEAVATIISMRRRRKPLEQCLQGWLRNQQEETGGRKEPASPDCTYSCPPLGRFRPPSDSQRD